MSAHQPDGRSAGQPDGRRASIRFAADLSAVLVASGPEGPQVCAGRVAELGAGGCTFVFDGEVPDRSGGGVLVVDTPVGHLAVLTAEPLGERGRDDAVVLRFVRSVEPDPAWSDYVDALASERSS